MALAADRMRSGIRNPLSDRSTGVALFRAYGRALFQRGRLPPGRLQDIGEIERAQRTVLLDLAQQHGPVFKGVMERRLLVCVLGHERGRRLLKEHAGSLRAVSIALESLFPHGFMRGMEGDTHRRYRKALVQGLSELVLTDYMESFQAIASTALASYANKALDGGQTTQAWADTLSHIASSALIALFYGVQPGTAAHQSLLAAYHRLGPKGVAWTITSKQAEAYRALSSEVADLGTEAGGLLGALRSQGPVDSTLLGNLVYMVELGRYDLRGLLRWISRYAAADAALLEQVAGGAATSKEATTPLAEAFVLETLRMDQSERLMRTVKQDILFDGWLIPKGALLRVCMWEAHKDADAFPKPFTFNPLRFITSGSGGEQFSPFGLDHHLCPLATPVIRIATAFTTVLARDYLVTEQGAEPAVRGPYHWEPSPGFRIHLQPKTGLQP